MEAEAAWTGEMRVVRYWSSGTPCMRSTGVEEHAVRTEEEAAALAMSKTKKANSGPVQYVHSKNSVTGKAMARANAIIDLFISHAWDGSLWDIRAPPDAASLWLE